MPCFALSARATCTLVLLLGVTPVAAQSFRPLLDARLRYENVDQEGIARDADALTLRFRPGFEIDRNRWSMLIQGETTAVLDDRYNSGSNGKVRFPLVVDPGNAELDRAQLRYRGDNGLALTLGRQRIELLDQRFVGSCPFRQNEQTFDAARFQWGKSNGWSTDITYTWSARTVNGNRGLGARPTAIGGDNVFALLSHGSRWGTATAFAYLVDQDEADVQNFALSSQTYGIRFNGSYPITSAVKAGVVASYARQSDYHRNPNHYRADYSLIEISASGAGLAAKAGREVLGADKGKALTSVQTPLASLFPFQGWADKFTSTPPDGVRDLYATVGYGWTRKARISAINISSAYHRFSSDRVVRRYGDEWDLLATVKVDRALISARYASYQARNFGTNTRKMWLSIDWSW